MVSIVFHTLFDYGVHFCGERLTAFDVAVCVELNLHGVSLFSFRAEASEKFNRVPKKDNEK
jgi:hypothetical protein